MLKIEWFTKHNFPAAYKRAKNEKKMLVFERTKQIVADFEDRKDKVSNPIIEVYSDEGLLIVSRIVNFQHELRQLEQDIAVTLRLEGDTLAKIPNLGDFLRGCEHA